MKTFLYLISGALVIAFAFWAYNVNYTTQEAVRRVADLNRQIAEERAAISMLNAEWAYLNRPDRLRVLAEEFFPELRLMPMSANHFGDPSMVAYPIPEDPLPPEGYMDPDDIIDLVMEDDLP